MSWPAQRLVESYKLSSPRGEESTSILRTLAKEGSPTPGFVPVSEPIPVATGCCALTGRAWGTRPGVGRGGSAPPEWQELSREGVASPEESGGAPTGRGNGCQEAKRQSLITRGADH